MRKIYNWELWFNGDKHCLHQGRDFDVSVLAFKSAAVQWAARKGYALELSRKPGMVILTATLTAQPAIDAMASATEGLMNAVDVLMDIRERGGAVDPDLADSLKDRISSMVGVAEVLEREMKGMRIA